MEGKDDAQALLRAKAQRNMILALLNKKPLKKPDPSFEVKEFLSEVKTH